MYFVATNRVAVFVVAVALLLCTPCADAATSQSRGVVVGDPSSVTGDFLTAGTSSNDAVSSMASARAGRSPAILAVCAPVPVTITGPTGACSGENVPLDAGTGFSSYLWSTGATTQTVIVTTSGTYSVTVTDANGCTGTDTHTLEVTATPAAVITASGPTTFCYGNSVTLTASSAESWLWSNGETTQSIVASIPGSYSVTTSNGFCSATSDPAEVRNRENPPAVIAGPAEACDRATLDAGAGFTSYLWSTGATTQTIEVTASGTYGVTITDGFGCQSSDTHPIVISATPVISASGPTTFCNGDSVTLTATAADSWLWSTGATTQSIVVTSAGTYAVTATTGACSGTSAPVSVTLSTEPFPVIAGPADACDSAILDAGAGFSAYAWSTGATTRTITVTSGGTYSVTVTNASGCQGSDSHVVAIGSSAVVNIAGPVAACDSATLDAGSGFSSYLWSTGATTRTIEVTTSGTYNVTVTNADGCPGSDSHTVSVTSTPAATITASGPTTFCDGGSVTLTANAASSWLWSTGETTQSIIATSAGTYSVTMADGSCSATSAPVSVLVTAPPAPIILGPANVCDNATLDAGSGFSSYLWSTGATTRTIEVTTSGTYSVTVTNADGCQGSDSHDVSISAALVNITGPATACVSATLDAGAGFSAYLWSTGATTQTITVTAGGTYGVTVTGAGGCGASDTHAIDITAPPAPAMTAPPSVCSRATGQTASVAPQPGTTYAWTITNGTITSAADGNAVVFSAGSSGEVRLAVSVTNGSCASSASVQVPITAAPQASITAPASAAPGAGIRASVAVQAGATYFWSMTNGTIFFGQGTDTISFSLASDEPATLRVSVTHNGCTSSDTHRVTVAAADLKVVTSAPSSVYVADTFDYSIVVTNLGTSTATGVRVVDTLPPGVVITNVVQGAWQCRASGLTLVCTGELAPRAESRIAVTVNAPQTPGVITNSVTVSSDREDPKPQNNTHIVTTTVGTRPCAARPAPLLVSPANGATVFPTVTFSWTPVPDAIEYRVLVKHWVSEIFNFYYYKVDEVGRTTGNTLVAQVPEHGFQAWVEASFADCGAPVKGPRIDILVRSEGFCRLGSAPMTLSPANASTVPSSIVPFTWTATPYVERYRIWASAGGAAATVLGETRDTSFEAMLTVGPVTWWVEAVYDGCPSRFSPRAEFTVPQRPGCNYAGPQLVAPAHGTSLTNGSVTFRWTAVPNALSYEVWLAHDRGPATFIGTSSRQPGRPPETSLTHVVPPGRLHWFVRTLVDLCPFQTPSAARQSARSYFDYAPPAACVGLQRPLAISPLPGSVVSPVTFSWSPVPGADYELFTVRDGEAPERIATLGADPLARPEITAPVRDGRLRWFVRARVSGCAPLDSAERAITVVASPAIACTVPDAPRVSTVALTSSGTPFLVQWTGSPDATSYELQVASNGRFTDAETVYTTATQYDLMRTNTEGTQARTVYMRVRAANERCMPVPLLSWYGQTVISILPQTMAPPPGRGGPLFVLPIFILGPPPTVTVQLPGVAFNFQQATIQQPIGVGIVFTPQPTFLSARLMPGTSQLPFGTTLGELRITPPSSAETVATHADSTITLVVGVSKTTPVIDAPRATPSPDALIIPAVAHTDGANSHFQSDVAVTNGSAKLMQYDVTFTPSGPGGLALGRSTTFPLEPGQTVAMEDVLNGWFGVDGAGAGTLDIRPVPDASSVTPATALQTPPQQSTFASSRTFNVTPIGTFGQHIPAVPYSRFIGKFSDLGAPAALSLQQIAHSDRYRTNLGIVEGSNAAASVLVSVFGDDGRKLTQFPVELAAGEHVQLNGFLPAHGITSLENGRVELAVTSSEGRITGYASVIDNTTNDPMLVSPASMTGDPASRWVVPGVASIQGAGLWRTDMHVFNAGTHTVEATMSFHSQKGGEPRVAAVTIPAGGVRRFDDVLTTLFGVTADAGAVHITTPAPAHLVTTARTYVATAAGTFGQFISAVTPAQSAGIESPALQLLQVEESSRYRSNVGLAEVTGNAVTVEVTLIPSDAQPASTIDVQLAPNESRQFDSILRGLREEAVFNARITVRVVAGTGRVTAYASVIDQRTNDPTYVPAQ